MKQKSMFADRTGWVLAPNALTQKRQALRVTGVPVLDLTESNPTRCGIRYPEGLLDPLADPRSLTYEPDPKGLLSARETVASLYAKKKAPIDPERVLLTASTSEAYSFLFRLLTNPGDSILVPRPSYPLFEYLAKLDDLRTIPYSLRYSGCGKRMPHHALLRSGCAEEDSSWSIDVEELSLEVTDMTRAIVVVHPNNPTGSILSDQEITELSQLCQSRGLAMIADEVFAEYLYSGVPTTVLSKVSGSHLTFCLGGLSKFLGLPQMKLAWIAATGPSELLPPALERLEMIADTYLSVNTPAQWALSRWMTLAPFIQAQIRKQITVNRQALIDHFLEAAPVESLKAQGGWYAILRVPSIREEESWVVDLLEKDHVLVYPGYFFDFEERGILVVSLLAPEKIFQEGIRRLLARIVHS